MSRLKASCGINLFIGIMEFGAWISMMIASAGTLSSSGIESLKYFTVLSNLFLGVASLVFAYFGITVTRKKRPSIPAWVYTLKYVSVVAVGVTLVTVAAFLTPMVGFMKLIQGANLWFHLVLPVLAIVEFAFVGRLGRTAFAHTFLGCIPTLAYSAGYLANIIINGIGEWPNTNDWYYFLQGGGIEQAPAVVAIMLFGTWIIALALYFPTRKAVRPA